MADTGEDDDARFRDLEARIAEQEKALSELSDELYRQQRHVALLDAQVRQVVERLKSLATEPAPTPQDETPPHY
jgi:SlyX protein